MNEDLVRRAIALLEQALGDGNEANDEAKTGRIEDLRSDEAWLRFYKFLDLVGQQGDGGIDIDRQRELMLDVGYDPRASGGFFGGVKPSLRRDASTDQRFLTDEGRRQLRIGRARFGPQLD